MHRRTFIKAGCFACTSLGFLSTILQSCASVKYGQGTIQGDGMVIDLSQFGKEGAKQAYIIVRHDDLQYPICVYRISDTEYSALLMRCTHQGAELQVAGDQLTCPAHGSEFDKWGKVTQSPASNNLRNFPVAIQENKLFIDLRKPA